MSWKIWTLFAVTETVLCLTPGPAVLLVVAQGLSRGRIAALWSSLGILAGNAFYFLISATGIGAILLASYNLFSLIKWIGAGYLVWLGIATIFARSSVVSAPRANAPAVSSARMALNGFVLQGLEPQGANLLCRAPTAIYRAARERCDSGGHSRRHQHHD